jgi:hypothetical protein
MIRNLQEICIVFYVYITFTHKCLISDKERKPKGPGDPTNMWSVVIMYILLNLEIYYYYYVAGVIVWWPPSSFSNHYLPLSKYPIFVPKKQQPQAMVNI